MKSIIPIESKSIFPGVEKAPLTINTLTAPVEIKKEPVNTTTASIVIDQDIEDKKPKNNAPTKKDNTFTYLAIGAGFILVCVSIYLLIKK